MKTAEEILFDSMLVALREDKPEWPEEDRVEACNRAIGTEPLFKRCLLEAMESFAAQSVREYKEKLKGEIGARFKEHMAITPVKDLIEIIESTH